MSKRIPFDVQFLLESILSEDPDTMEIDDPDADRLNAKGASIIPGNYDWETNTDAVPFWIDSKNKVVVFSRLGTHGRMDNSLSSAARAVADPVIFDGDFKEKSNMGCVGMFVRDTSMTLYFFGGGINTFDDIKVYLKKSRKYLRDLVIRDGDELCGRAWIESNVVSFWNTKAEIDPVMKLMLDFMRKIKMDPTKCGYEFADSQRLYGYTELGGNVEEKDKLSPEELHALQKKKHLKKDKQDYGPEFWEKHGKKAAKGFDIAAKADAAMPALEGRIKLKDLLKENPDFVSDEHGGKIAKYFDSDAVAFFAFPEFSIMNRGGVHYDMINTLSDVHDDLDNYSENESEAKLLMDEKGFVVSNISKMLDALDRGPLHNFLKYAQWKDGERSDNSSNGSAATLGTGGFRIKSGGLAGRVWTKKKIISFWNRKEDVVKRWNEIEKMFNDLAGALGNLSEYRVDWLERDASLSTPLTPASEVSSAGSSSDGQQTFLDTLFGEKKLSDEEIKKLQARLHTMSAKEKKEVMMAMGYSNTKAAEIADKLGMTVAQFNHIMNVNEDSSNSS